MQRNGPKPLSFYLSMASSRAVMAMQNSWHDQGDVHDYFEAMLRGIRLYQDHPYVPQHHGGDVVWTCGSVTLRRLHKNHANDHTIVLVPSLINGSEIMDLCAERSLAGWLCAQGFDVVILDWGDLEEDAEQSSLEVLIAERMLPAFEFLCAEKDGGEGRKISALGYCMGGTMLLAAAHLNPALFQKIVLLATPWDFHRGEQKLTQHIQFFAPQIMPRVLAKGRLNADWIQALFAFLDPNLAQKKFARFAEMDQDSDAAKIFIAVEDWINDGRDLPGRIARETIEGWFAENKTGSGEWQVCGQRIDPSGIHIPVLVVASSQDKLVAPEAAFGLADIMPDARLIDPACGHVGMIAGRHAIETVWTPIGDWLKSR